MTIHRIGRYEVIRMLPGTPAAYLAHAPGIGTCVVRRIGPAAPEAVARAVREASLCAGTGLPGIAPAEFFADGDHVAWAVPEREGASLAQWIGRMERGGLAMDPAAVWHVVGEIAAALAAIHALPADSGPVPPCHGFLSPEWVWLSWEGSVSVEGAGLSAAAAATAPEGGSVYTPPEQRNGGRATPRGDVYSLAAMACHLHSGRRPQPSGLSEASVAALPSAVRELLVRAFEPILGKRTVTATELELAIRDVRDRNGAQRLAEALRPLRRGTTMMGTMPRPAAPTRSPREPESATVSASGAAQTASVVEPPQSPITEPSRVGDSPAPSVDSVPLQAASPRARDEFAPSQPLPGAGETLRTTAPLIEPVTPIDEAPTGMGRVLGIGLSTATVVFALGLGVHRMRDRIPVVAVSPSSSDAVAPVPSSEPSLEDAPATGSAPPARAILEAVPEPSSPVPGPTAGSSAMSPTGAPVTPMGLDPASLGPGEAIVLPRFREDPSAEVFSYATSLGKVNQPIVLPCKRYAYLRVGVRARASDPIRWLSAGQSRRLECRKVNEWVFEGTSR